MLSRGQSRCFKIIPTLADLSQSLEIATYAIEKHSFHFNSRKKLSDVEFATGKMQHRWEETLPSKPVTR